MYYPYFRGKQFELIAIREAAEILASANFIPIIEPVKESLNGLDRALQAICDANGRAIVVVNPNHGDLNQSGHEISNLLRDNFCSFDNISAGILLKKASKASDVVSLYNSHKDHNPVFIHAGFSDPKGLIELMSDPIGDLCHIFIEKECGGKVYRRHFKRNKGEFILIRDGFKKRKNADYPLYEFFSDLHITYEEENMTGFGDFLMVGNDYSEGGGPAYAVAIHITFIDDSRDEVMGIYHFVSESNYTPTDPGKKFSEALSKMASTINDSDSKIFRGSAVNEFLTLHKRGHFPGLGTVKKISMKHHIETLANYFGLKDA